MTYDDVKGVVSKEKLYSIMLDDYNEFEPINFLNKHIEWQLLLKEAKKVWSNGMKAADPNMPVGDIIINRYFTNLTVLYVENFMMIIDPPKNGRSYFGNFTKKELIEYENSMNGLDK